MASESEPRGRFPAWWQSGVIYQIYARSFQDPTETVSAISTALHLDRTILSNSALMPLLRYRPDIWNPAGFRSVAGGDPWQGPQAHFGFRAEPYLRPASMVYRKSVVSYQCQARLVHLARSETRRQSA
jgi:hypothetical protein